MKSDIKKKRKEIKNREDLCWSWQKVPVQGKEIKTCSCDKSRLLLIAERLHLHLQRLFWAGLCGRRQAQSADPLGGRAGVEGTHQPVERRVVDQVIHDVVQRLLHLTQLDVAAGQHTAGQSQTGVELHCRAAEGQRLPLDVVGKPLHARHHHQAGRLELLAEGTGQRQCARLDDLRAKEGQRNPLRFWRWSSDTKVEAGWDQRVVANHEATCKTWCIPFQRQPPPP